MGNQEPASRSTLNREINIRRVVQDDLEHVVALDERVTSIPKPEYWQDVFERYAMRRTEERFFLVAEAADSNANSPILGLIVGEVRAWEFGSRPCGWVFAFSVDSNTRLQGIGEQLYSAMSKEFKAAGIETMRTMVARENQLLMAFFRSEGMVAGPYIQLEKDLNE